MAKVLIATEKPFSKSAVEGITNILTEKGHEVAKLEKYTDPAQLLEAVADAEALIIRSDKITAEVMEHAPKLKLVVRAGAGYDNVDLEAATAKGIVVENTPGQNANAVAELVMGMMVYKARNFFDGSTGKELRGKKIGLHGFGAVARCVAPIAKGFGMDVYAYDIPQVPDSVFENAGVTRITDVPELYKTCDYVSLHFPALPNLIRSINYELLSNLPKNGCLINAARAEVVDEDGIIEMFEKREDFVYLADVAPKNKAEIAEKFPGRFFFTPKKAGAQTAEANANAGFAAARQICDYFETGSTRFQVNK
ncbi:MAG: hypothetical protein IKP86_04500 [Anaerolineaceae bacterium]|nr:hypothetical protein [Anaerolineaceae bacterium]